MLKKISKKTKAQKSVRSSIQHRILCTEYSNKQFQQTFHDCVSFTLQLNLPNQKFPTNEQVLLCFFSLKMDNIGVSVAQNVCLNVMLHWISCNVYIAL